MKHGHVTRNKDGSTARCGGPGLCSDCSNELVSHKPDGNVHAGYFESRKGDTVVLTSSRRLWLWLLIMTEGGRYDSTGID